MASCVRERGIGEGSLKRPLDVNISVCICTRNRPDDLCRAIMSVTCSSVKVIQIIVSDDSTDDCSHELIQSSFPEVTYTRGPKRGLCANRNRALSLVAGTHVMFLDDDVLLHPYFIEYVSRCLSLTTNQEQKRVIITGLENQHDKLVYPHEQNFLGFQARDYQSEQILNTIVINSTVFPTNLFNEIRFDEQLVYGYDEVDISTRAVKQGYQIILCPEAVNQHFPSQINRDYYSHYIAASRLYVTFKRYMITEEKALKALMFVCMAIPHTIIHGIKLSGLQGLTQALRTLRLASQYIRSGQ